MVLSDEDSFGVRHLILVRSICHHLTSVSTEDNMKITRFISALFILIGSFSPAGSALADDLVGRFEVLLSTAKNVTNAATPVYFNQHMQAWAKRRFLVADIKFDVKKTDSLVNPVVGLATFNLVTEQTDLYQTKEEAVAANVFQTKFSTPYRISLKYSYKNDKWFFSKGIYESINSPAEKKIFELSEEDIKNEPTSTPAAALIYWLPK